MFSKTKSKSGNLYIANIVCKKGVLFQVEIKKKVLLNMLIKSVYRPNQQIKPHPTRWHYPLITYLNHNYLLIVSPNI